MKLSVRLTVVFGVLGILTIPTVAMLSWVLADGEIRAAIDDQLLEQAERLEVLSSADLGVAVTNELPTRGRAAAVEQADGSTPPAPFGSERSGIVFYDDDGTPLNGEVSYLSGAVVDRLDTGESGFLQTVEAEGRTVRVVTLDLDQLAGPPAADRQVATLQIFNDISSDETALSGLAVSLAGATVAGVLIVICGGFFVGRWLAKPVLRVTDAAEQLAELDDLPGRIVTNRNDELGRLASSFNRMLAALEIGREQQQRLVADASHELRTPLTSLRMRTEFLAEHPEIAASERQAMLDDAVADVEGLSALVADLVDLAADVRVDDEDAQTVRLADIIDGVVSRTRVAAEREIITEVDQTLVIGRPGMIRRAVQNLVDNAVKYSPGDDAIVVRSSGGSIEVEDDGPGIHDDEAAFVFDRFYRSPKARSRPGNGIGLAIVKQVADAHDGTVWATSTSTGGARVGFSMGTVVHDDLVAIDCETVG